MFKMRFPEHSGSHLATGGQNSSTSAFKRHLGATWPTEARTQVRVLALVVQRPTNGLQPTSFRFFTILNIAFRPPRYKKGTFSVVFCKARCVPRVFFMGASIEHIEILLKTVELRLTKIENNDKLLYFCMLFTQMCVSYGF